MAAWQKSFRSPNTLDENIWGKIREYWDSGLYAHASLMGDFWDLCQENFLPPTAKREKETEKGGNGSESYSENRYLKN